MKSPKPFIRLFIDPSCKASGYALFKGKDLIKSGSIIIKTKDHATRLNELHWRYQHLFSLRTKIDLKETHIEQFGFKAHRYLINAVGVIMAATAGYSEEVEQDIPVKSWQKYIGFTKGGPYGEVDKWAKYNDNGKCINEDELSAIGMGMWYMEEKLNEGN